jgi:hypothetical protein
LLDVRAPGTKGFRVADWPPEALAFFNERIDVLVDGNLLERPITRWSRRAA